MWIADHLDTRGAFTVWPLERVEFVDGHFLGSSSVDEFAFKPKGSGKRKRTKTDLSSNPKQSGAEHVGKLGFV